MRVPKVSNYKDDGSIKNIKLEKPLIIPKLPVITTEKQRDKLIKTIEKYIRGSLEYKDLIKFLKDKLDMSECAFFHNTNNKSKKVSIEIHHEPFSLYDLVSIVMAKHESLHENVNELEIAEEVMYLHYSGKVGLIPLSTTVHELVHVSKIMIPLDCVYGNFVKFVQEYYEWIDPIMRDMLMDKIDLTKKLDRKESLSILNVRYVYIDVDGYRLPEII